MSGTILEAVFPTPRPRDIKIFMEDEFGANFEKQINAWLTNIR